MSNNYHAIMKSPLGTLGIEVQGDHLLAIDFLSDARKEKKPDSPMAKEVVNQLGQYFKNPEWEFSIPLLPADTAFRRRVRNALNNIPAGKVRSYGAVAKKLRSAPRAVGGACRANPVPIVVPCHRVVAQSGIGGFSGSTQGKEIMIKQWLLSHEGVEF
ncbi:MAG: methylated-DNA--[protein]-cysteine S-methyltransferase [Gammaproteobacteria bacterium]|nr:methylated-DNA--[protein]-cysteine S-methyltransferase [Gammaproteobacteria bacterium]